MKSALIVDDKRLNRRVLMSILKDEYDFLEASDGREALDVVAARADEICVVLLNIVMPGIDGFGFMRAFNEMPEHDRIPVIMITGSTDEKWEAEGFELGAADYIRTPYRREAVRSRVKNIVELFEKQRELRLQRDLTARINERITSVLASLVEFRDLGTGMHVQRVRGFTRILMGALRELHPEYGITAQLIDEVSMASALHDIGKIGIPDSILLKPARLTREEFDIMRTHTQIGLRMIDRIEAEGGLGSYSAFCRDICLHHHERYDGRGYPDGLRGDDILIYTQVVSICDVYEALTDDRAYRARIPHAQAVRMIEAGECGAFSPTLIACFERAEPDFAALSNETQREV